MKSLFVAVIVCAAMLLALDANPQAIQPVDAGLQPLRDRVEQIDQKMQVINANLQDVHLSPDKRHLRQACLHRLVAERARLQAAIDGATDSARNPLIVHAMPKDEGTTCGM